MGLYFKKITQYEKSTISVYFKYDLPKGSDL